MKRRVVAAVWIAGATVPLLLATVFLVGCCVLPFHEVMHKLMPLCEMAANVMRGDHAAHDARARRDAAIAGPREAGAGEADRDRSAARVPARGGRRADAASRSRRRATTGYRSFITLGAVRCDRDVGLHVLVETFLI